MILTGRNLPWLIRALCIVTLLPFLAGAGNPSLTLKAYAQSPNDAAREQAAAQLARLTPEERIGQLFIIAFQGADADPSSPVHTLITDYHVGGVVLLARNDNIVDSVSLPSTTTEQVNNLIQQLQTIEWDSLSFPAGKPGHRRELPAQLHPSCWSASPKKAMAILMIKS